MQKRTIDNLLKKGKLSGEKAGKLELQEYIRKLNGESQILSETERQQLIKSLLSNEDRRAYNGYMELCRILHAFDIIAKLQSLQVEKRIWSIGSITSIYNSFKYDETIDELFPVIMTEKEYEEKSKEYYNKALKEKHTLEDLFLNRVNYYVDNHEKLIPELWKQYENEEKEGKKEDPSLEYGTYLLDHSFEYYTSKDYGIQGFKDNFPDLFDIIQKDLAELFKSKKLKSDKPFSKIPLKDYHKVKFTGKEILKTGLPEISVFFELENEYIGRGIAILKKPDSFSTDEKGYYRNIKPERTKFIKNDLHNGAIENIKNGIKEFYFYSDIISAITSLVEMEFKATIEEEKDILGAIEILNLFVNSNNALNPSNILNSIDIEALKTVGEKEKREKLRNHLKAMSPMEYYNLSEGKLYNLYLELNNTGQEPIEEEEALEVSNEQ